MSTYLCVSAKPQVYLYTPIYVCVYVYVTGHIHVHVYKQISVSGSICKCKCLHTWVGQLSGWGGRPGRHFVPGGRWGPRISETTVRIVLFVPVGARSWVGQGLLRLYQGWHHWGLTRPCLNPPATRGALRGEGSGCGYSGSSGWVLEALAGGWGEGVQMKYWTVFILLFYS